MEWYLIVQILTTDRFHTLAEFKSEQACQAAEANAQSKHTIGVLADPPTLSFCVQQRKGSGRIPSRGEGEYVCRYAVGKFSKLEK
jgi:hypothetical protein